MTLDSKELDELERLREVAGGGCAKDGACAIISATSQMCDHCRYTFLVHHGMPELIAAARERDELKDTIARAWEAMDPEAPQVGDFVERCEGMTKGHLDAWGLERTARAKAEGERDDWKALTQNAEALLFKQSSKLNACQQERDDLQAKLDKAAKCMAEAADCIKHGSEHRGRRKLENFLASPEEQPIEEQTERPND